MSIIIKFTVKSQNTLSLMCLLKFTIKKKENILFRAAINAIIMTVSTMYTILMLILSRKMRTHFLQRADQVFVSPNIRTLTLQTVW